MSDNQRSKRTKIFLLTSSSSSLGCLAQNVRAKLGVGHDETHKHVAKIKRRVLLNVLVQMAAVHVAVRQTHVLQMLAVAVADDVNNGRICKTLDEPKRIMRENEINLLSVPAPLMALRNR